MLSDDQLIARLVTLCRVSRRVDTRVIVLLIEVEDRRLELKSAYPSLYDFCRLKLGMSESTTYRRIMAVRLVRKYPFLIAKLDDGSLSLSTLVELGDHITTENVSSLVEQASGKSKREIKALIATIAPKPDVPERLHQLPEADRAHLDPLAPNRWRLELTASQELHDKLLRAQSLMRHGKRGDDLSTVVEAAIDVLLVQLEKARLGKTPKPRAPRATKPGRISQATRRAVFARDGEQCTFVDKRGARCPATTYLQLDHVESRARGGADGVANVRVRCAAHNRLHAEQDFGKAHVSSKIAGRRRRARAKARAGMSKDPAAAG